MAGRNGFAGDVALSVAGLPAGAGASVVPAVVPGGAGTAQVTVGTPASLAPGTYPLTLTGTSGALVRTAPVTLVVSPPPDFGLTVTPAALTVVSGGTGAATVGVAALDGFAADVALSVTGLPAEVGTATVTPAVVSVAGTAQLLVTVRADAPAGSYPVTVTGTGGGRSHTAAVTVVVPVARHRRVREPGVEDGHPAELHLVHGDGVADQRLHRFGLARGERAAVPVHGGALDRPRCRFPVAARSPSAPRRRPPGAPSPSR